MLESILNEFINTVSDKISFFFNTDFWSLVGYTGIAGISAVALAYFFPTLRGLCGAVVMSLAAMWYGYHKGQASDEKQVERLKEEQKQSRKDDWTWK